MRVEAAAPTYWRRVYEEYGQTHYLGPSERIAEVLRGKG